VYVAELAEPFRVLVRARGVHLDHLLSGHPPDGVEVVHGAVAEDPAGSLTTSESTVGKLVNVSA
jgi:hypothetical protein